jgi:5'(3')-deoxyribonucleotidase
MKKETVFCDVDDVVAGLCTEWIRLYNAEYDDTLRREDVTDWNIAKFVKPECGADIFKYLHRKDLYDGVLPIDGAWEGVFALREMGYRVVFATACNISMAGLKLQWLDDHGFLSMDMRGISKDYIEINDKHLLRGGTLIDDYPVNLDGFEGRRLLFSAPHNQSLSDDEFVFTRAADWTEVVKRMEIKRFRLTTH